MQLDFEWRYSLFYSKWCDTSPSNIQVISINNYLNFIENKLDNEETQKLISDDDLKELVLVVGDRLLTKKILNQFFTASHDEQCVCFASSKYF